VNPNATWSISLESYYPYLQPQEVSKAPTTSCNYSSLPKSTKSHFGCHSPLGIKNARKYIFSHLGPLARNGNFERFFRKRPSSFRNYAIDLCILNFLIIYIYIFRWIKKQWVCWLFWIFKIWFWFFLWTCKLLPYVRCIFNTHQHLGIFCTTLHNSNRSVIWYSISQHEYKHKCELPYPRGGPHFL
jgi:hypothetical protein